MRISSTTAFLALALGLGTSLLAACTVTSTSGAGGLDGGAAADGGACAISGKGTLTVTVTGLPEGLTADASIEGNGTTAPVVSGQALSTAGGSYKVTAKVVVVDDKIVRTVYAPTIVPSDICVTNGGTSSVTVTYAPIPTSNKLWHLNDQPGQLLGFASASLGASGSPAATVVSKNAAGRAIAFDRSGNLWAVGATTSDAPVARYSAASLAASGNATPDREMRFDVGCQPGIGGLAFASDGALWAASGCGKKIARLAPTDLEATGDKTLAITLGGVDAPEGIAFDKAGNLWAADPGSKTIARFDAARLGASSTDAPSLVLTPMTKADGGGELDANTLVFDKDGNLWVLSFGTNTAYKLTAADLAGTATKKVVPGVQIVLGVTVLPEGITIDEAGALWIPGTQGKISRLGAGQLGTSTTSGSPLVPDLVISSPDIGYAAAPAFFPAAKGTPMYAALP